MTRSADALLQLDGLSRYLTVVALFDAWLSLNNP